MQKGKATVGYGTSEQREMEILDFFQSEYKDHRLITFCQLEDGSFVATIENPTSTGRSPQSNIWLSKESMIGLIATGLLYFESRGEKVSELLQQSVEKGMINYTFSDNLKQIAIEKNKDNEGWKTEFEF
jgi:hypothetical protein